MNTKLHTDRTIADGYYTQLPTGGATQGDIWTNLPSGSDSARFCSGVIITPRCDFAHANSPVINYLPIISLEEYILSIGVFPFVEQFIANNLNMLRQKAADLDVDVYFELDLPADEILRVVQKLDAPEDNRRLKKFESARTEFQLIADKISYASSLMAKKCLTMSELSIVLTRKNFNNFQRDLIRNNNSDTYFLPPCQNLLPTGSIVLLRYIYTCPITQLSSAHPVKSTLITEPRDNLVAPERLLRINSPFLESLMSKLAALFTRVGTRDIPVAAINSFTLPYSETDK